jgi:hypothetical protein
MATTSEKNTITDAINKIDYILKYKFITPVVKADLEATKALLQTINGDS